MRKIKLLRLLGKLSSKELKEFRSYMIRHHKRQEISIALLENLRPYHPNFSSKKLDRKSLFKKIIEGQEFNEKRLLNEMSKLSRLLEDFLIAQHIQENKYAKESLLLEVYKKHQLDEFFFDQLEKMEKKLDQEKESTNFWLKKLNLASENYYYPTTKRITDKSPKIYEAMTYLDNYYSISKLKYACEFLNRNKVLQDSPQTILLLEETISTIKPINSTCHTLYTLAMELIKKRENSIFYTLKEFYLSNLSKIKKKDQLIIFNYLINHTSYCIRLGLQEFNTEVLKIYRFGVDNKIMIINGYFDKSSFENTVIVFCKNEAYKWAEQFLVNWQATLNPRIREITISICKAYILFERSEFEKAENLLTDLRAVNFLDQIRITILLLSCYVELKRDDDDVITKCENFERASRRNRIINQSTRKAIFNFTNFVKKIYNPNTSKILLLKQLNETEQVFSRNWLIEKIQSYKE